MFMSISPGFTAAEIREFVHEYHGLPWGRKAVWLVERQVSRGVLRRWSDAVYDGNLERG